MHDYIDRNGYQRHSSLIHREIAFEQIYKKNRAKYPLRFRDYVIHHKDGNKRNNNVDNLEILTPEEHEKVHEDERAYKFLYEEQMERKTRRKRLTFWQFLFGQKDEEVEQDEEKPFNCLDCGRPIRHKGRCLACNTRRKNLII